MLFQVIPCPNRPPGIGTKDSFGGWFLTAEADGDFTGLLLTLFRQGPVMIAVSDGRFSVSHQDKGFRMAHHFHSGGGRLQSNPEKVRKSSRLSHEL